MCEEHHLISHDHMSTCCSKNIAGMYRDVGKKREPKLFSKKSQNFGPINLKTCMNNLNTHKFQHIKYKILNPKTFGNTERCF